MNDFEFANKKVAEDMLVEAKRITEVPDEEAFLAEARQFVLLKACLKISQARLMITSSVEFDYDPPA
jgi:hypothetical protein